MSEPIRVFLADDHPLIRSGIGAALDGVPDMWLVGEAAEGASVRQSCQELAPDVIVLDLHMPGPPLFALVAELRADRPAIKVIILTAYVDDDAIRKALAAGVDSYIFKEEDAATIVHAIRVVAQGGTWFSQPVAAKLAHWVNGTAPHESVLTMTLREIELLRLIVAGKTNCEIGATLEVSEKTVEKRVSALFTKLRVTTRVEAAVRAVREGLV